MKTIFQLAICFCIVSCADLVQAQEIFPQFADGKQADGSYYQSTIAIQSSDDTEPLFCELQIYGASPQRFTNAAGQVLQASNNSLTFTLPILGLQIFQSAGTSPLSTGMAVVTCADDEFDAFLLFSYYSPAGVKLSEATVFPSQDEGLGDSSVTQMVIDERAGAKLGIAMANYSTATAQYNVFVEDTASKVVGTASVTLNPTQQTGVFLDSLVTTIPANFVGRLVILPLQQFAGPSIYAIGLRYSGVLFTTVPISKCYSGNLCSN